MAVWIDAQLPPALAAALRDRRALEARHVHELGLTGAKDEHIFRAARDAGATVVTKDSDFVRLLERHGPPPRILWLTVGNVGNAELEEIVLRHWDAAQAQFDSGQPLVEIHRGP
ncbi:MAG TPA: DUF5615 family PIN-like protein [Planctomycetota bacterium]